MYLSHLMTTSPVTREPGDAGARGAPALDVAVFHNARVRHACWPGALKLVFE